MTQINTARELFETLFVPFPDDLKTTKRMGGKGTITFVEWYHYTARAWKQFPKGFSKEIRKIVGIGSVRPNPAFRIKSVPSGPIKPALGLESDQLPPEIDDRQVIIVVRITDEATGNFQESTGSADASKGSGNYGGCSVEAEHQATKRAFAHFGLGLEMYMDEEDREQVEDDEAPTKASQDQINRMVQLIGLVPDTEETADLTDFIGKLRAEVSNATDKAFHTGMAIDAMEARLTIEGIDLPDPT